MSAYVKYCVDMIIPSKKVVIYPNNKPWVTKELKSVINRKKKTFYLGDLVEKKAVSREVKNEIKKAKSQYRNKIENQYNSGDLKAAWQGIKTMAAINQPVCRTGQPIKLSGIDDGDLPDIFNKFSAGSKGPSQIA